MKNKTKITLGLILFLSAALVIKNWSCSSLPELEGWYEPADEISVTGKDISLLMSKKDNNWFINEQAYPGDPDLIEALERKARDFKLLDLVSDKGYYDRYDLTEDSGITVLIKGKGKMLRKIIIGKEGSTNNHTYIKVDDRKEIYLASGVMKSDFAIQAADLREKRVFDLKRDEIQSFTISYNGKIFDFRLVTGDPVKKEGDKKPANKWICAGYENLKLNDSSVNSILALFSPLKASEFPVNAEWKNSGNSICRITIPYSNKKIELEIFSKKDKDMNYAWSSESKYIFTLGTWQTEKFFIKNITSLTVK